nr:hypothetical protein GCM10020092_095420 [Actinoplanes digitatis]
MNGEPYTGGGIRTTVAATRAAGDDELLAGARRLVLEARRQGTTTVEIKSGYGLSVEDEARSLRIARQLTDETTFLGAHVVPAEYADDPDGYVALVSGPMLEAVTPYAKWIDVFCDRGAFDGDQAREVLTAGVKAGLMPRVHANQLVAGPGVRLAVELGAASADHCTHLSDADVAALAGSETVATLLPGAEFSTRSPYPDARRLLDAGVTVALATDCNPGSSYTSSMPFCLALAVREMRMTPAEALWAATAGGARALRRDDIGVVRAGARGDLVVLDAPSYLHLAYRPGVPPDQDSSARRSAPMTVFLLNPPASRPPTSSRSPATTRGSSSPTPPARRWPAAATSSTRSRPPAYRSTGCRPASAPWRTPPSPRSAGRSCSTR